MAAAIGESRMGAFRKVPLELLTDDSGSAGVEKAYRGLPDTHRLHRLGVARHTHRLAMGIRSAANHSEFGCLEPLGVWVSGTPPDPLQSPKGDFSG
jgi:hypothetical protein